MEVRTGMNTAMVGKAINENELVKYAYLVMVDRMVRMWYGTYDCILSSIIQNHL